MSYKEIIWDEIHKTLQSKFLADAKTFCAYFIGPYFITKNEYKTYH